MLTPATVIVPCFNEASRLDRAAFVTLARKPGISLLFVDDGSTDGTSQVMEDLAKQEETIAFMVLPKNQGKGEAVRQGLLRALERGAQVVGYFDADLSTPIDECVRLAGELDDPSVTVILGSRIAMLGTHIDRQALRHYASRAFATGASIVLQCAIYDTQCGAKFFRRSPALEAALSEPFTSRWAFDVELIGRLMIGKPGVPGLPMSAIKEVPLLQWTHVAGSKLRPIAMFRAAAQLGKIGWVLEEARRKVR
jgi:glycosyltransferase involved in cell wall biosynthesis